MDKFFPYSREQLGFDQPVTIVFQSDEENASKMLGKTAHYDPESSEVMLYVDNRHPKDVMRSLSHELVHHAQNCRGDLQGGCDKPGWNQACVQDTGPGYAQRDPHMRKMEREAYTKGNLIFRDFEDLIKTGKITIEIDFSDSGEPKMSLKEWKNNEINTKLMKKWGLLKEDASEELEHPPQGPGDPGYEEMIAKELEEGHEQGPECGCSDVGADEREEDSLEGHLDAIEHHLEGIRGDIRHDEEHMDEGSVYRDDEELDEVLGALTTAASTVGRAAGGAAKTAVRAAGRAAKIGAGAAKGAVKGAVGAATGGEEEEEEEEAKTKAEQEREARRTGQSKKDEEARKIALALIDFVKKGGTQTRGPLETALKRVAQELEKAMASSEPITTEARKISTQEAKEITRRIVERIKKESN